VSKTRTKSKSKIDRLFDDKAPRNRRLKNFNEFADDDIEAMTRGKRIDYVIFDEFADMDVGEEVLSDK